MLTLLVAVAVFTGLAVLVLRWAERDLAGAGEASARSLVASWLLYVFHADTVFAAAWAGMLAVEVPRSAALTIGIALAAGGFAVFIAGTLALVRHGDFKGSRTRRLVTTGPYSLSRHPQNLGWGVLLLGIAIAGRSLAALALVGLFAIFVERYARLEDHRLQQDFGAAYDVYRDSTPAVLSLRRTLSGGTATRRTR